jgi:hypothetical protein
VSNGDVPSPAARRPVQTEPAERNGLSTLPWDGALFAAVSALEAQLDTCRKENAQLRVQLSHAREWARKSNANWALRREAWHRERSELLARLDDDGRRP